jgi:hypothetical protein
MEPGSNNAEMDQNAREVMAQWRRKATTKGYRKGLACWAAFCARRHFTDKNLVHVKKILLFLKDDVLTMRIPKKTKGTKKLRLLFSCHRLHCLHQHHRGSP